MWHYVKCFPSNRQSLYALHLPTARMVIIYTVSFPIVNLHYPRQSLGVYPERSRRAENGALVFSFSSTSSKPLPKKIFRKRKRFFGHWSASSTAHSSIRAEKNHFCLPQHYQTAQSIIVVIVFYMVYALRHLITPTKSNFFQL